MDYANEVYVRLYTRDTTTWKRLRWQGQVMLMQLLRKVDRSGTLETDGLAAWEAAALHTGMPDEIAQVGVDAMLALSVLAEQPETGRLVFPNFIEAQETPKSDRLRQRESRDRRAAGVTNRDGAVTIRDSESRIVTERHAASRAVTPGHAESRDVTLTSAVLCSALPCYAQLNQPTQERSLSLASQSARECDDAEFSSLLAEPADSASQAASDDADSDCSRETAARIDADGAGLCPIGLDNEWPPDAAHGPGSESSQSSGSARWSQGRARLIFIAAYEQSQGTTPSVSGRHVDQFAATVARTAELQKWDSPEIGYREALGRWLARPMSEVERRAPYACFAQAWGDLTATGRRAANSNGRPVREELAPASAFDLSPEDRARQMLQFEALASLRKARREGAKS